MPTDEIDDLLSQYKSTTMETVVEENDNQPELPNVKQEENTTAQSPVQTTNSESWQGNPAYFQTGKKAGTIRPNMKHHAPPKEEMQISGSLIDGAMFLMLVDLLFPLLITVINNKFSDTQISLEDLQATDKQKKDLAPVFDEIVKQISMKANPIWLGVIGLGGIYGINFMAAKQAAK